MLSVVLLYFMGAEIQSSVITHCNRNAKCIPLVGNLGRYSRTMTFKDIFFFARFHETSTGHVQRLQATAFFHCANFAKTV